MDGVPVEASGERARGMFEAGWCCAESVLVAMAEAQGIKSDVIPRIATGFCAGMARTTNLCGAVSGAIMGISLATGRNSHEQSVEPAYALVRRLLDEFGRKYGSTNCGELLRCDLGTEAGQAYFKANKLRDRCAGYVDEATRIALGLVGRAG